MDRKTAFLHVGITVSDIDRSIEFYQKYFGFELERKSVFPPEFIEAVPQLYRQKKGTYSHFAFLRSPDGVVLELFQFSSMEPAEQPVWNRPGYHHICLKVDNVIDTYKKMSADGIEFYFEPKIKEDSAELSHWVFFKDPDGNMVELQD
jgi:catechol 2,3-dioxygenase-like lactoylglutathione lyase family enzyme